MGVSNDNNICHPSNSRCLTPHVAATMWLSNAALEASAVPRDNVVIKQVVVLGVPATITAPAPQVSVAQKAPVDVLGVPATTAAAPDVRIKGCEHLERS